MHITGGESPELVKDIQKYPEFISSLSGKVVGGSSAGACLFSTYYWYGEEHVVHKGLGVLPIRLVVHYGSSEYSAAKNDYDSLKTLATNLELVMIEECAWIKTELKY